MKILGVNKIAYKDPTYIVEITLDEIKKVANKSAYREGDGIEKLLEPGSDYPIAEGYDFRKEIVDALNRMTEAHKAFAAASVTMARFAALIPIPRGANTPEPFAPTTTTTTEAP